MALDFDSGSSHYADGAADVISGNSKGTIAIWCIPETKHSGPLLTFDNGTANTYLRLAVLATGAIQVYAFRTPTQLLTLVTDPVYDAGDLLHVAVTQDNSNAKVYVNGQEESVEVAGVTATWLDNLPGITTIRLGSDPNPYYYNGIIIDAAYFDTNLSDDEIATLYAGGQPMLRLPLMLKPSNCKRYWPLDAHVWTPCKDMASGYFLTRRNSVPWIASRGIYPGGAIQVRGIPFTGYRMYRGTGGLANVDFDTMLAKAGSGSTTIDVVGAGHAASTKYTYVLRPVLNELETPDLSCNTELVTDSDGEWVGTRPGPVEYLSATPTSGGKIVLRWSYRTPSGKTAPSTFNIYYENDPNLESDGSPNTTETYTSDTAYSKTLTLSDAATYYFVVTAESSGGVESSDERTGPVVADSTGPSTPVGYVSTKF